MYTIEIPGTVQRIIKVFLRMGLWSDHSVDSSFHKSGPQMFYFIYYMSFTISVALGCYLTDDNVERVFLTVFLLDTVVLLYKMWYVLSKNRLLLHLLRESGTHCTNDQKIFIQVNNSLNFLMKFGQYFVMMISFASFLLSVVFPVVNYRRRVLFVNIAVPFDKTNEVLYWIASAYLGGGIVCATVMCSFAVLLWYMMYCFVMDYKFLGSQLRDMGKSQRELSATQQQNLYHRDILWATLTYDKINGKLKRFASMFSNLFLLQMATSSICICGMVYSSAFSKRGDLVKDGVYLIILSYAFFDIFMIMFIGNEIKLSSEALSYSLFKSNWIIQTQSSKKSILIFEERLKRHHELIISKIYKLNLSTFTSIVNTSYSMFNLLQNFREE